MIGDHMGAPYSRILLPFALYVMIRVCLSWPQDEPAKMLSAYCKNSIWRSW